MLGVPVLTWTVRNAARRERGHMTDQMIFEGSAVEHDPEKWLPVFG
jgi:hypothetical protein